MLFRSAAIIAAISWIAITDTDVEAPAADGTPVLEASVKTARAICARDAARCADLLSGVTGAISPMSREKAEFARAVAQFTQPPAGSEPPRAVPVRVRP